MAYPQTSYVVAYHYKCPDGVFAALAAHVSLCFHQGQKLSTNTNVASNAAVRWVPMMVTKSEQERIDSIPQLFHPNETVLLLDFSGGPKFIRALCQAVKSVVILDHHKTAQEDLASTTADGLPTNLKIEIDMLRSGAGIARDYFKLQDCLPAADATRVLRLFDYIQDGDLWKYALPKSKEFSAGFASLGLEFDANINPSIFTTLLSLDADNLIMRGVDALAEQQARVTAQASMAFVIEIPSIQADETTSTRMVGVISTDPELRSALGNELAMRSAQRGFAPVAAVAYIDQTLTHAKSLYKVSLRSTGDWDTTSISRRWGGGGHRNASSFNISRAEFLSWRVFDDAEVSAFRDIGITSSGLPRWPVLYTPGPLTTSPAVKAAMCVDYGSRDARFLETVRNIRSTLLSLANVSQAEGYECVLMQGSGTYVVESVLSCTAPRNDEDNGKLLIVENGAYGRRMAAMAKMHNSRFEVISFHERGPIDVSAVIAKVNSDTTISHVAVVHHETTAGVLNAIHELGVELSSVAAKSGRSKIVYIVDSMSAFGAYPVDLIQSQIDFLVSSSNKCIEGVPGFAFAICSRDQLRRCAGRSRSLALDLYDQWDGLEKTGQFRFTPPTHVMLAFQQALMEHAQEGGCEGRLLRYTRNFEALRDGMHELGFQLYVQPLSAQGCIISTFLYPDAPQFDFMRLYNDLAAHGFVIYPGKLTHAQCFRIGNIGRMYISDVRAVVAVLRDSLIAQGIQLPVKQITV